MTVDGGMKMCSRWRMEPDFRDEVRAFAARHSLTKTALAKRAGLHANTLRRFESDEWSPNWRTLEALRDATDELEDRLEGVIAAE